MLVFLRGLLRGEVLWGFGGNFFKTDILTFFLGGFLRLKGFFRTVFKGPAFLVCGGLGFWGSLSYWH